MTTWQPVDLRAILDGGELANPPTMLSRRDGTCLLYPGKLHELSGEPEAGKGWLSLAVSAERLTAGEAVLYLDFETEAREIVGRLRALGVGDEPILDRFHYVRPDQPLTDPGWSALEPALQAPTTLAVLDGVTEALGLHGLSLKDNDDIARWLALLPRRLVAHGLAVLQADHVVKDREGRGRYSIGAQHKLAGVDVGYRLEVIEPFGIGRHGRSKLLVTKDRPGHVRQSADARGCAAHVELRSLPDGAVQVELTAPETDSETFRPTFLMERVSRAVERAPGISKRAIRETVHGKATATDLAIELLETDGHLRIDRDGQARRHYIERPYREAEDQPCPRVPTVSQPCPGHGEGDRVPVSPPIGDTDTGHTPRTHDRVPTNGGPPSLDADVEHDRALSKLKSWEVAA